MCVILNTSDAFRQAGLALTPLGSTEWQAQYYSGYNGACISIVTGEVCNYYFLIAVACTVIALVFIALPRHVPTKGAARKNNNTYPAGVFPERHP